MRQMAADNADADYGFTEGGAETLPENSWGASLAALPAAPQELPVVTTAAAGDMTLTAEVPQTVSADMLVLLAAELAASQERLMDAVSSASTVDEAGRHEALDSYAAELEPFANAAEGIGLTALKAALDCLQLQVATLKDGINSEQGEALTLFPGLVLVYLQTPDDPSVCQGMTDLLQAPAWRQPLTSPEAAALARRLAAVKVSREAPAVPARAETVSAADVSLDFPPDLNPELLSGLLQELPLQTGDFSAAIQRLTAGRGSAADVETAKRSAHTLKGAAHTVGIKGIANLTHHLEDILIALSDKDVLPGAVMSVMLTEAADCLEAMSEAVMGIGPQPERSLAVLQDVLNWANRIDREGEIAIREGGDVQPGVAPAGQAAVAAAQPGEQPVRGPEESQAPMMWVSATVVDELLRLVGETIISTSQIRERLRKVAQQNGAMRSQNTAFLHLASELEHLVDIHGLPVTARANQQAEDFDPLEFEHYSELHTVSRRLIEAAHDSRELGVEVDDDLVTLKELVEIQNRLHMESQKAVLLTRMVQVKTVVPRLQRSLRQACRLLDKQVDLDVSGVDTPIDTNILNELMDPLMHLLRNAVDHGIEAGAVRTALGKNPQGAIELSFSREANHVVVACQDDGAGLDLDKIRALAIEKQLISGDEVLSDDELARLILRPGFSTRGEATQISGRGIGMDIVNSRVLEMKGSLSLRTTRGRGLRVELRVPAALISTHALLVRQGERVVALSTHGIEDIHYASEEQIQRLGDETLYQSGVCMYPLVELEAIFHNERRSKPRTEGGSSLLLVRLDSGLVQAVRVQEILDSRDLVIKKMSRYLPKIAGVVGAAILGDGKVSPVIDLPELLRAPLRSGLEPRAVGVTTVTGESSKRAAQFTALVVDDSLSARRTNAQLMRDAGFEVRTAIDGMEAAAILSKWTPSVLLVDMEMPRMNGLELTTHVRSQPGTSTLPIVMITSRSTEKHRQQARAAGVNLYLTKPYRDQDLLAHVTELTAAAHGG